jgi:hypothetical protein
MVFSNEVRKVTRAVLAESPPFTGGVPAAALVPWTQLDRAVPCVVCTSGRGLATELGTLDGGVSTSNERARRVRIRPAADSIASLHACLPVRQTYVGAQ